MAGSFRIAEGYVEITTRLDKEKIRAAAREAAAAAEAEMTTSGDRSGRSFSDHWATAAELAATSSGRRFTRAVENSISTVADSAGNQGTRSGDEFVRRSVQRLRDSRGRFVRAGEDVGKALGDAVGNVDIFTKIDSFLSGNLGKLGSKITSWAKDLPGKMFASVLGALQTAAGFLAKWGTIFVGSLQVAPPILAAIAAGLAAIPALAIGAAGAIATLGLGFHGIGAAIGEVFNPSAGGGGAANNADQVAAAERRLTLAQRAAADAQDNLNKAREEAVNDLIDLNLQLAGAHLDEQAAILQVKQAEIDLANARNTAQDPLAQERAKLALLQAQQALKETQQRTAELQQQTDEANAAGVEGSAKVKSALEQVESTTYGVQDAQDALKQSFVSAGAAAVTAYSKLSPNAKAFVDEIRKLKPELVDLQQYVQDRLFAGLGAKLDVWAHVWLPGLKKDMGDLAGSANGFVKRLGDDLSKPGVRGAVDAVFGSMGRVLDRFTNGGALDKLVTGFSDLVTAATPFVEKIATGIVDELGRLGDWLSNKSKSGAMSKFFSDAAHDAKQLWEIGKDVFAIISDIIGIAFGKEQPGKNGNPLDQIKDTLDKVKAWTESDKGKQTISDIIQGFHDVGVAVVKVAGFVSDLIDKILDLQRKVHNWWKDTTDAFDDIRDSGKRAFLDFEGAVVGVFGKILGAADTAFGWMPGLGGKLANAKSQFDDFALGVKEDMDSIPNRKDITIAIAYDKAKYSGSAPNENQGHRMGAVIDWHGGRAFQSFAGGGIFPGVAGGMYRFAERETGEEMLMPANSPDMGRQRALATWAAQHAGGTFVANQSAQDTPPREFGPYVIQVGGHTITALMVDAITGHPREVATAAQQGNRSRSFTNARVKA